MFNNNNINNNINLDFNFLKDLFKFLFKRKKIDIKDLRKKGIEKIKNSTSFYDDDDFLSEFYGKKCAIIINYQPFLLLLNLKQQDDLDKKIVEKILTEKKQILEDIENKVARDYAIKFFIGVTTYRSIADLLLRIQAGVFDEKLKELEKKGELD